eukprot:Plantae.Rhodophyta-Purpureofilum_apyrenoidigerum.ctg40208.p1 GENE.Plantae.Rhodophyta-Purpureofilum_apyrenoidigerum.ctg40208~~Plantae.Rhodophyta-Purpureofilum_apyrenoidigerum.ctg40208.p1  ORF type:complete len:402 (-),score=105.46 Plantae.Rhodophyta-Purpureofilum_apyrenoidigerum.ctg40208:210-1415(-)
MRDRQGTAKRTKLDGDGKVPLKVRANDVIFLESIRSSKDAIGLSDDAVATHPKFTNQLFEKEEISGYENLRIDIQYTANSMKYFVKVHYDKMNKGATDIEGVLDTYLKNGRCKSRTEFLNEADLDYVPPIDNVVRSYGTGKFHVYKGRLTEGSGDRANEFKALHERVQFQTLLHIDGASYIDAEDPKWEVFMIFEEISKTNFYFVGYATIYPFIGIQDRSMKKGFFERIRISQVLILPTYQKQGHGSKLLQVIYEDCASRKCLEITVEDPSEGFRILRDCLDLEACVKRNLLSDVQFAEPLSTEILKRIRTELLITKNQAIRCHEMNMLRNIRPGNEDEKRKFRLFIKRRLYQEYSDVLSQFTKEETKEKLAEFYDDLEKEYYKVLKRLGNNGLPCPYLGL